MFGNKEDKSVTIKDGGINKGIINTGDNVTIETPHLIPKKLTPQIGLANDIDFVGRKEELQKVDELLNQNSMLLLLNGIGGIGKSTLASYYLNQKKDNFDYYGFVQVNEDIKLSLASAFGTSLDLKSEKIDDLFAEIMNKLQNLEGRKLLIIDDVKEMDNQLDEIKTLMTLKNNSGFQILFTSRESKDFLPEYTLNIMNPEDARELFLKYYPTDEIDKVDKILKKYLDYHTLFIEITAKTLKKRKNTLSLDRAIEKFDNEDFTAVKRNKSESFNKFLKNFSYDSVMLTQKKNLLFLKRLSVLPSIEISFEDLYNFLVCEDEERLEDFLIELVDNGWLIESEHAYKFHQILKEFIWDNYSPLLKDIEIIIYSQNSLISSSENVFQMAMDNKNNEVFFYELSKYLLFYKIEHLLVGDFFHNLGVFYQQLEEYKKSLVFQKKASLLRGKFENESLYKASSDDSLAILYKEQGRYEEALPLYQNALKIRESILGTAHIETAASYNNLGVLYRILKRYDDAMILYQKCLKIKEKELGNLDPSTAQCYNNIALIYNAIEDYETAISYYNKALNIWVKEYGENHQDTAKCYNNLGVSSFNLGQINKAIYFHIKALNIRKEILGETNYTAQSYFNLGGAYLYKIEKSKKYRDKVIENLQKAINIWEKVNPTNPQLIEAKKLLSIIKK